MLPLSQPFMGAYMHLRTRFGEQLLGCIEIGSQARGEAISCSDHDLRLVIRTDEPFVVLNERHWTDVPELATTLVDWEELNPGLHYSFGLTNLGFVARAIEQGRFPLNDHTSLFQGRLLIDETGTIATFLGRNAGMAFPNIAPDYGRQTEWRVTNRLAREANPDTITQHLDNAKFAIPLIHTCYRIVRDIAQIACYQVTARYLHDSTSLDAYYRQDWPAFYPTFQRLRAYKTDEPARRRLFAEVQRGEGTRLTELRVFYESIVALWRQFAQNQRWQVPDEAR